jgi:hypothetical protein
MKKLFLAVFISFFFAHVGLSQSITFSDQVIEEAVRESLYWMGVTEDSNLTSDDLKMVSYLELDSSSLSSLADLSQLPNLQYLYLDDASGVSNFTPLWDLNASLIVLDISMAPPSIFSGLPDMENLQSLGLENNKLTDLSFLLDNNFSSLTHLDIEENHLDLGDNATLEQIATLEAVITQNKSQGKPTWYGSGVEYGLMYPKGFQNLSSERNRVSSGSDAQSLLLKGIYELLHIFEDRSSSGLQEFAIKIGVESSIRGFLLSDLPTLESYDANLSENLQTDELAKYFQNSFIPALKRADTAFASVQTDEAIELSSDLTGSSDDFTVDQADIYVLRAITNLAAGLAALQSGYDWNFKIGDVNDLDDADQISAESLFDLNTNFAGIRNASLLANAKSYIEKAIEVYELASPLLRDANRSEDRLFVLSPEDHQEEDNFLQDLSDLNDAMQGAVDPNDEDSFDLSRLFAGKVDLPDLIPALDGDKFSTSDVPDPTMGGLMPNWDQRRVRQELINADLLAYAPSTLIGQKLTIQKDGILTNDYYFTPEDAYFWDLIAYELKNISYFYERNSSTEGILTLNLDSGDEKHQITFSSSFDASSSWENNLSQGSGSIQILDEEYAPDYLNGWKLDAGASTYKFTGDSTGVFYHEDEGNYSDSELSNIIYTWEKAGPGIGKLYTSLDEITWLFFEDNTTGRYHWQEQEQDNNGSGYFSLNYYPDGHAHESLAGDSLKLGDTIYVFTSDTSVTVSEGNTSSVLEYAYLKNGSNKGILSLDPENRYAIMDLTFYSSGYGRVDRGGSGYFQVLSNWATKGWVWYDHYPWAYSNNMQDWYYQVLFINDDNESDMAHYQVWNNQWNIPGELHYSGESNFSSADGYYWEDYDEFNGSDLNTTKWDVAWWDGGTAPSIDQANNRVEFTKGSSYEANLSDLMNIPNPNAESEYSRGYSSTSGNAPSSLADSAILFALTGVYPGGITDLLGEDRFYFSEMHSSYTDMSDGNKVTDSYSYAKNSPDTATIITPKFTLQLIFSSFAEGTGSWTYNWNGFKDSGTLTFKVEYSPHSLLEFVQSDDIEGIEFELMIPSGAPDQTCIGLFAVDYNEMFNATSDEQEEGAMKFDLDLCYFDGLINMEFNHKDPETGEENSTSQSAQLGAPQKITFYYGEGRIHFFHNDQPVKDYPYERGNEKFVIRAQNEQNLDFSAYLRNVRVLRKKSYPQGWMWMDYYPWVYSHQSNSWVYFQLAKDTDGQPGMIYWDTATKDWDIYYPSLSAEQEEDQENATILLNQ